MANNFIDPDATNNGDGTAGTPAASPGAAGAYNTFVGITPASDNNYYVKRGTAFNFWSGVTLSRFRIIGLDNIICGAYYLDGTTEITDDNTSEPLPILTSYGELTTEIDWVEVETNVWVYNQGANFSQAIQIAGLGSLAANLQMEAPYFDETQNTNDDAPGIAVFDTFGEWHSTVGYADIVISSITPGATTSLVLASGCENQAGTQGMVLLSGITITSGVDINGWHLGTFASTTAFTIPVNTTGSSYADGILDRGVKLGIYSDENPITKWGIVFVNNTQSMPFLVHGGCDNITVEYFNFKHAFAAAQATTGGVTNLTVRYIEADNCWTPIKTGANTTSFSNGQIHHNTLLNNRSTGIYLSGEQNNTKVYLNKITNSGVCNPYGCIYWGASTISSDAATPCLAYENTVSVITAGKKWKHEAFGIYPDFGAANVHVFNNYVYNCGGMPRWTPVALVARGSAIHCNSGLPGIEIIGNLTKSSPTGISLSDSGSQGLPTHVIADNVIIDAVIGMSYSIVTGTSDAYNNIIYNDGTGLYDGRYGIMLQETSEGGVTQDYNLIFGFTTVIDRAEGGGTVPLGANSVEADPLLDSAYNNTQLSPCVGAGVKYWSNGPRPTSYNGEPKPDTHVDIGSQSTWNPLHPKNI